MARLNVKLIAGLSALLLTLGVALFSVHYFQSGRIAKALLGQAQRAEEKSEPESTAQYLHATSNLPPQTSKPASAWAGSWRAIILPDQSRHENRRSSIWKAF